MRPGLLIAMLVLGLLLGWWMRGSWLHGRLSVRPVFRAPDGEIVGYMVKLGNTVLGRFTDRTAALRHRRRVLNALDGRAAVSTKESDRERQDL